MFKTKHILPIIVISQFCCTSLWFAGNGVINDLIINFNLQNSALGHLTAAVQYGFIIGTLMFSVLSIADRFSPSKVFMASALLGALFNLGVIYKYNSITSLIILRSLTGFFLAGIYPVGMKIAADYFEKGLGKSLGYLVGALVLGTALPHLLKEISGSFTWQSVIITTSALSSLGGLLLFLLVPNGPFRKASQKVNFSAISKIFKNKNFRSSTFGYFGHMWELYAFWTFVPLMLNIYAQQFNIELNIPLLSFLIIGIGGIACIVGGYISFSVGIKKTAYISLLLSCICCLIAPFMFSIETTSIFLLFLFFWSFVVIADSPLLSTLVAQNSIPQLKGTALTIISCLGYFISTLSIQLINKMLPVFNLKYMLLILAIGPIFGVMALGKKTTS